MNDLINIDRSLPSLSQDKLISILLYGSDALDNKKNRQILICTIQFIKDSHRFGDSLFLILSTLLDFANPISQRHYFSRFVFQIRQFLFRSLVYRF